MKGFDPYEENKEEKSISTANINRHGTNAQTLQLLLLFFFHNSTLLAKIANHKPSLNQSLIYGVPISIFMLPAAEAAISGFANCRLFNLLFNSFLHKIYATNQSASIRVDRTRKTMSEIQSTKN